MGPRIYSGLALMWDSRPIERGDENAHPYWFSHFVADEGIAWWDITSPMWFVMLFPALGLWWSWRGRKDGTGFPVEAVIGEDRSKSPAQRQIDSGDMRGR